eukprot:TRINITY_DN1945_c0_g1_i1.p1 TRINITY_DN1945_c0_g1~~TRINITY_DN1945_c0_g1_i1.p1  ORF type:complete len:186 (-),score=49.14 TRINITY_DN1945_c0_g1_i1:71-550(-)
MGNQACCSANDQVSTANEQTEFGRKEKAPGAADLPAPPGSEVAPPSAAAGKEASTPAPAPAPAPQSADSVYTFKVALDKASGGRLGIDVDHKDNMTLLIEQINEGLVMDWNNSCKDPKDKVVVGDRIIEVNGVSKDVPLLVDECKKNVVLNMVVKRDAK